MKDLRADWQAVKPKGRRRPVKPLAETIEDIHEDWLAVRGGRHPAYGFIVRWEYPTAIVIWRMAVTGKRKTRDCVIYMARYAGVVYKTPGFDVRGDTPENGVPYTRDELFFTREEVEQFIEGRRRSFVRQGVQEIAQLRETISRAERQIQHFAEYLHTVSGDPVPFNVWEKFPRKQSKRLE